MSANGLFSRPDYGRRLLPHVIDQVAQSNPQKVFASIPRGLHPRDGFEDVHYGELAYAINKTAWFLQKAIGDPEDRLVFAYIGPSDMRYHLLACAAMKTGHQVLYLSPRNSIEGQLSLLDQAGCSFLLMSSTPSPAVAAILKARTLVTSTIPELRDFLNCDEDPAPPFPFALHFEQARLKPFMILHTSGSTGIPKIVHQKHGHLMALDTFRPECDMANAWTLVFKNRRVLYGLPFFHLAGIMASLTSSVYYGTTIVFAPLVQPLNVDVIDSMIQFAEIEVTFTSPAILVDIANNPIYLEHFSKLKSAVFAGGPLPSPIGNVLKQKTFLLNGISFTEGIIPFEVREPYDWEYFRFLPAVGATFQFLDDDLYEMVMMRDERYKLSQTLFVTFPNLQEYHTKDLYSKHPTEQGLWLYRGRSDDIIVFSNGEKLNPVTMENLIHTHPQVDGALVVGQGRFQSALIVEPVQSDGIEISKLLDSVWTHVQRANSSCVAHGRIARDLIIFTNPDKPFARAGKGTIQRHASVKLYQKEIEELYNNADALVDEVRMNHDVADSQDSTEIRSRLLRIITQSTGFTDLRADTDLTQLGIDSLQVLNLVRAMNKSMGGRNVDARMIYSHPSVSKLAQAFTGGADVGGSRVDQMKSILDEHASDLPITARPPLIFQPRRPNVLLTGSTGSLGSYLLDRLISNPDVGKIYCLNRSENARHRQLQLHKANRLSRDFTRVEFLRCKFAQPYLGLETSSYARLLRDVTHILHNAWTVDFNLPLAYFSSQIRGVRQLVDFSTQSSFGAHIYFISTVASVSNWRKATPQGSGNPIPEAILADWDSPERMGYGESKYVSERLLQEASARSGTPVSVCRVGQIAGPVSKGGVWPRQEWLPTLIASSKALRQVPASLGAMDRVDWVPVDLMAEMIVYLLLRRDVEHDIGTGTNGAARHVANGRPHGNSASPVRDLGIKVHQIVNPRPTSWSSVLPAVVSRLPPDTAVVSFSDWLDAVRHSSENAAVPAVKLLGFFEDIEAEEPRPVLETRRTAGESAGLAALQAVSTEWMGLWMRQWGF